MPNKPRLSALSYSAALIFVWLATVGTASGGIIVNESIDITFPEFIPCANDGAGEIVVFEGKLHVLIKETVDSNGGLHTSFHFQPQGLKGEGQVTGDSYNATGGTRQSMNVADGGLPSEFTFVNNFKLIGPGPGNNFLVHDTNHVTINANGETTAVVVNSTFDCK